MRHDDDVVVFLKLHNYRLQPYDHVAIGFPPTVPIVVLVIVSRSEVFGVKVGDLFVGKTIADARVELVEGFPFQLGANLFRSGEEAGCLDGPFQGRRPDSKDLMRLDGFRH